MNNQAFHYFVVTNELRFQGGNVITSGGFSSSIIPCKVESHPSLTPLWEVNLLALSSFPGWNASVLLVPTGCNSCGSLSLVT